MRAFYTDFYGCHAELCQTSRSGETRLTVRDPHGSIIHRKYYKTWRGARTAMGKLSDCWHNDMTGKQA